MTREEMHIKALSKGIDSQTIKGSMTVMLLGHAVDMMMELQDTHEAEIKHLTGLSEGYVCVIKQKEAELKAKNEKIYDLSELLKLAYRDAISIGIAHQQDCKAKDEHIAELEAMVEKMKCCENCNTAPEYISPNRCGFCKDYSNWQLKDNK